MCDKEKESTERTKKAEKKNSRNYVKHGKTVLNNKEVVSAAMPFLSAFVVTLPFSGNAISTRNNDLNEN